MKSALLLSLILSLPVACSSTPDESNPENLKPKGDAADAVAAEPAAADEKKAAEAATAVEANPASAPAEAPAPTESPAPAAAAIAEKIVYPTASLLNLRQGPGKSHGVARLAKFGEGISLTGEQKNTWLKTTDGHWVSSLFVAESKPSQANDPVVEVPQAVEQAPVEAPAAPAAEQAAAPAAEQAVAPAAEQTPAP